MFGHFTTLCMKVLSRKAVNYCFKALHFRCVRRSWLLLCFLEIIEYSPENDYHELRFLVDLQADQLVELFQERDSSFTFLDMFHTFIISNFQLCCQNCCMYGIHSEVLAHINCLLYQTVVFVLIFLYLFRL